MIKKVFLLSLLAVSLLFAVSKKNVLALSWENSFCLIHPYDKACRMRRAGDFSLNNFVLHGLWPWRKEYCRSRYKFELSPVVWEVLQKYMPAAKFGLAKHEWRKHGTCFGTDANTYFITAVKLTQQFDESGVATFIRMRMGSYVSLARLRYVFASVFGNGSQRKFQLICKRKNGKEYITEIRINLYGNPLKHDLGYLIKHAKDMIGVRQCQGGIVAFP
jgi:ribonuclease T2